MMSFAAGTSVANARRFRSLYETVEYFLDRVCVCWTDSCTRSKQVQSIARTVISFLQNANDDDPVLIGVFDTGLSEKALIRTLFNADVSATESRRESFTGKLGYGYLGTSEVSFNVSSQIQWVSPFEEDRPDLMVNAPDSRLVVTSQTVIDLRNSSLAWTEERIRPSPAYGPRKGMSPERLAIPLGKSITGQVFAAESLNSNEVVDPAGIFLGGVFRITVFRRRQCTSSPWIPSNGLHIQVSPSGLVCSIGVFAAPFAKFSRDLTNLRNVFAKGGAY